MIYMIMMSALETPEERSEFLKYYYEYKDDMYKVAYHILGNQHDAEDAVSQAIISVIDNFKRYSKRFDIESPGTRAFFVTITEHKSIDIIRDRMPLSETGFDVDTLRIPSYASSGEDSGLREALAGINSRYRDYLLMRYDMGYSIREMSELLGESVLSVRKTVYRAKKALEDKLTETAQ